MRLIRCGRCLAGFVIDRGVMGSRMVRRGIGVGIRWGRMRIIRRRAVMLVRSRCLRLGIGLCGCF